MISATSALVRFRVPCMGQPLVVAIILVIGPSVVHAAPPASPQTADGVRDAAQRVTREYIREIDRANHFEREGREQIGMSRTEQLQQNVRESMAWQVALRERPKLIQTLDVLGQAAPEDDWIVGHRVGFRILHERYGDALEVARSCRASPWWCAQLTGLAYQILGNFPAADSAFTAALEEAPPDHACDLRDISVLLDHETARRYVAMRCEDRRPLEERFWWLADPLYVQPVNDRRTEHWARTTFLRLHDEVLHTIGGSCPQWHWDDVMTRGWPDSWWNRGDAFYTTRYVPGVAFVPHADAMADALMDPLRVSAEDWDFDPDAPRASGERYDHPNGPTYDVDHQVAFFRRGDSTAFVGAIDLRGNPLFLRGALDAWLVLARDEHDPGITVRKSGLLEPRYLFRTTVPAERHLVSVEVIAERGGFGRARFGDGLPEPGPGGLAPSSLLMFEGTGPVEEDLDAVAPLALGTTRVPSGQSVGLYWEVYGLEAAEELEMALRVRREGGRGLFRRLAEAVRLVDSTEPVTLQWQEQLETEGFLGRVLDLDISNLEPGRYTIELEARAGSHGPAVSRRRFEVVPPGS